MKVLNFIWSIQNSIIRQIEETKFKLRSVWLGYEKFIKR